MKRFLRELFLNSPADCEWMRGTHLKAGKPPQFASFVVAGNEDSPARVDLYASQRPEYNERPVAVYEQNDEGELACPEYPNNPAPVAHHVIRRTRRAKG